MSDTKMENVASDLRTRLDSLLRTVIHDDKTQKILSPEGAIPEKFLEKNGIVLVPHEFDKTDNSAIQNMSHDPPILFSHLPLETFQKYPILGPETSAHPKIAEARLSYPDYKKNPEFDSLACRVNFALYFLERWAWSFPRKGTVPAFVHLHELPGLTHVRVRHGLFAGVGFANNFGHKYSAHLFEADSELERFGGDKPHLIMLGEIYDYGHNGSIAFGELALLLTGMRNRAFQRYGFIGAYSDSDEDSVEEGPVLEDNGFLFEDERRFPVLMVSIIGLQHARIYYACMDGSKVVIRQSKKYSMLKKDEETLNFLSSILLSSPLDEDPVTGLTQQLSSTQVFQERESDTNAQLFEVTKDNAPTGAMVGSDSDKENR